MWIGWGLGCDLKGRIVGELEGQFDVGVFEDVADIDATVAIQVTAVGQALRLKYR